ncbi:MAG TPA: hypothetical protein V6D07_19050 [Trichocoleus sp.]
MPAIVRRKIEVSPNLVQDKIAQALPVPMWLGSISLERRFEQYPSGTLEYIALTEADLAQLEAAYYPGKRFSIMGCHLRASNYSYERERFYVKDMPPIDVYKVSVSLNGGWEKAMKKPIKVRGMINRSTGLVSASAVAASAGIPLSGPEILFLPNSDTVDLESVLVANARRKGCFIEYSHVEGIRLIPLGSGTTWQFAATEIRADSASRQELPYLKDAELQDTWSKAPKNNEEPDWQREEPQRDILIEEDDDPEFPPADSLVLRTLDSTFDKGGPKKVRKVTYLENNSRVLEKTYTFGFRYTAEDIHIGDGLLFSASPETYWGVVDYSESSVNYVPVPNTSVAISAYDDNNKQVHILVHPDYDKFVSGTGSVFAFKGTAEYLTEEVTRGYRWARLKEETEDLETLYSEGPLYDTYLYQKLPKKGKKTWLLTPTRSKYGESEIGHPFSLEFTEADKLAPELQKHISSAILEKPGALVAVLQPDINFVEPYFVEQEASYSNSFYGRAHPESTPDSPLPPLITGQETYSQQKNILYSNREKGLASGQELTKVNPDHYRTRTTDYTSQDAGFSRSALVIRSQEYAGTPPDATTRNRAWQNKESQAASKAAQQGTKTKRYFLTSSNATNEDAKTESRSVENAQSLEEALAGVRTQFRIDCCNAVTASKSLTWWFPGIAVGDAVSVEKERFFDGVWRVMGVSLKLDVAGRTSYTPDVPLQQTGGTDIALGMDITKDISVRTEDSNGNNSGSGRRFVARYSQNQIKIGSPIEPGVLGRRNF